MYKMSAAMSAELERSGGQLRVASPVYGTADVAVAYGHPLFAEPVHVEVLLAPVVVTVPLPRVPAEFRLRNADCLVTTG